MACTAEAKAYLSAQAKKGRGTCGVGGKCGIAGGGIGGISGHGDGKARKCAVGGRGVAGRGADKRSIGSESTALLANLFDTNFLGKHFERAAQICAWLTRDSDATKSSSVIGFSAPSAEVSVLGKGECDE